MMRMAVEVLKLDLCYNGIDDVEVLKIEDQYISSLFCVEQVFGFWWRRLTTVGDSDELERR
jgi:hypothetical protein